MGVIVQRGEAIAGVRGAFIGGVEACSINVSLTNFERLSAVLWPAMRLQPVKEVLARRLTESRSNVSQERLAGLAHVSISLIAAVESGRSNTSLDQIEALATALGQDPAYWLNLDDQTLTANEVDSKRTQDVPIQTSLRNATAEDLRKLRHFYAMTQVEVAHTLGVSKGQISQIENARTNFSVVTLERYVTAVTPEKNEHGRLSYAQKLGSRIRLRRLELKLEQEQLAEKSGLTVSLVGRIERGTSAVSMDQVEQVALALGMEGAELLSSLYPRVSGS